MWYGMVDQANKFAYVLYLVDKELNGLLFPLNDKISGSLIQRPFGQFAYFWLRQILKKN